VNHQAVNCTFCHYENIHGASTARMIRPEAGTFTKVWTGPGESTGNCTNIQACSASGVPGH
jgi:hypothetical protein